MNRDPRRVSDRIMDMLDAISYIADDLGVLPASTFNLICVLANSQSLVHPAHDAARAQS